MAQKVKEPSSNQNSISGSGRSPGEGNGNPLQDSCLENPLGRGAWWAAVHGVMTKLLTLSLSFRFFSAEFGDGREHSIFPTAFFLILQTQDHGTTISSGSRHTLPVTPQSQLVAASSQKCVAPHGTLVKKSHCALEKATSPQHCGREGVLTHRPKAFYLRTQRRYRGIRAKASGQQTSLGVVS